MILVDLDPDALGRVRLTYSPMWELVCSLRLLLHEPGHRLHAPWLAWVLPRLDPELVSLLRGLMPTPNICPDFLTPTPSARPRSFRTELAAVTATDLAVARAEVEMCWRGQPPRAILAVLQDRSAAMTRLGAAVEQYWKQAVAPVWPRMHPVLAADVAHRADELAAGGLNVLLNRLHPNISYDGKALTIDKPQHTISRCAGPEGLVLVPSAFGWPDVRVVACDPYPVTLSYAARGVGTLWHTRHQDQVHPAAKLIGASRAAILALLDLPLSTTQLAQQTKLSLPAVSQHLGVLRQSGLVESRRAGRTLWNTRTQLGRNLLDAGEDN